jgi:TonB family protein
MRSFALASRFTLRCHGTAALVLFVTVSAGTARAQAPEGAAITAREAHDPALVPPRLIESREVPYPEGATGNAKVTLTVVVNRDGTVRSVEATTGDEPFASAAVRAARSFRFEPATRGGQAVAATIRFEVQFEAPSPDAAEPAAAGTPNGSATPPNGSATPPNGPAKPNPVTEVIVRGDRPAPATSSLTRAEVRQLPGAFGDPFRAIEAMPGVTPIISGLPYFYIRGAPPGNVGYFLDGVRVPYLFHIGAGPSIVNPALVDRVDLYPGGYPARFGRFAGGIVSGETTAPRSDFHAEGNLRLFDVGGVAETGFAGGRGTVLLGGRYSYTATALSLIAPHTELDYRDYQARVSFDITPHDRVTAFAFGSYDLLGDKQTQGLRVLFGTEFYRLDTRYDHFYGDDNRIRFAITLGYDQTRIDVDQNARDKMLGARVELTHHLNPHLLMHAGLDGTLDAYTATRSSYVDPEDPNVNAFNSLFPPRNDYAFGAYADVVAQVTPRLEVIPGLRADLYQSGSTTKPSFDARLAGNVAVTQRLKIILAFGLAHQPPSFVVPVPGLTPGTLANGLQTSFQSSAGTELTLPASFTATTTLFHNAFFNMSDDLGTSQSTNLTDLDQRSMGQAYGFELYVRRPLTQKLAGFLTYTLSRSTRSLGREDFVSAFDRTHVVNVALVYDLGKNWRAGARLMAYSGVPKRPDLPPGLIQPVRTPETEREPGFYRIDWRVEKRWRLKGTGWIAFVIEMLNTTFHKETVSDTEIGPVTIPSIGVEAGF